MGARLIFISIASLLILHGCSSNPDINVYEGETPADLSKRYLTSREYALENGRQQLNQAEDEELSYYSPRRLLLAKETLNNARQQPDDQQAIDQANQISDVLAQAREHKKQVQEKLATLFSKMRTLHAIHADKVHPKTYQKAEQSLAILVRKLESEPEYDIKVQSEDIERSLIELQVDTLLSSQLGSARRFFQRAQQEEANRYAPLTFRQAQQAILQAETTIKTQYQDLKLVESNSQKAEHMAQRALYLSREVRSLIKLSPDDAEHAALKTEQLLHNIAQHMKLDDLRAMSLQDQSLAIIQALENQQTRLRQMLEKEYRDERAQDKQRIQALEQQLGMPAGQQGN